MIKVLKRKQVKCCMNCKHWKSFPPTPGQATLGAGVTLCTRAVFVKGTVFSRADEYCRGYERKEDAEEYEKP